MDSLLWLNSRDVKAPNTDVLHCLSRVWFKASHAVETQFVLAPSLRFPVWVTDKESGPHLRTGSGIEQSHRVWGICDGVVWYWKTWPPAWQSLHMCHVCGDLSVACLSSCRNWRANSASVCQRPTLFLTLGIPKSSDGVFFKPGAAWSAVALALLGPMTNCSMWIAWLWSEIFGTESPMSRNVICRSSSWWLCMLTEEREAWDWE